MRAFAIVFLQLQYSDGSRFLMGMTHLYAGKNVICLEWSIQYNHAQIASARYTVYLHTALYLPLPRVSPILYGKSKYLIA